MTERSEIEIRNQIDLANDPKFFGMSYEDGVKAALEWVLGDCEEKPMDE